MTRSIRLLAAALLSVGCATTQAAKAPPGSGPALFVLPNASCHSDAGGAAAGMIPDGQLCTELLSAIKGALNDVGYHVVDSAEAPHAASARIIASQRRGTGRDDKPSAFVTVQVLVETNGQEVERAAEDGSPADDGGERAEVQSFASAIANELAHSPRMKGAGLVPGT
jgi:hypothetical protein